MNIACISYVSSVYAVIYTNIMLRRRQTGNYNMAKLGVRFRSHRTVLSTMYTNKFCGCVGVPLFARPPSATCTQHAL